MDYRNFVAIGKSIDTVIAALTDLKAHLEAASAPPVIHLPPVSPVENLMIPLPPPPPPPLLPAPVKRPSAKALCLFCQGPHNPVDCPLGVEHRRRSAAKQLRCIKCLRKDDHTLAACTGNRCCLCGRNHHPYCCRDSDIRVLTAKADQNPPPKDISMKPTPSKQVTLPLHPALLPRVAARITSSSQVRYTTHQYILTS